MNDDAVRTQLMELMRDSEMIMGIPPRLETGNFDFTITGVHLETPLEVTWQTVSAGFGGFYFWIDSAGKLRVDTEGMSKDFVKRALCALVDAAEFP